MAKIVFVDDERWLTEEFQRELKLFGHEVTLIKTADDLLACIKNRPSVDIFIIDLHMDPGALVPQEEAVYGFETGLALSRRVRDVYEHTPIVVFTSEPSKARKDELLSKIKGIRNARLVSKSDMSSARHLPTFVEDVLSKGISKAKTVRGKWFYSGRSLPPFPVIAAITTFLLVTGVFVLIRGTQGTSVFKMGSVELTTSQVGLIIMVLAVGFFLVSFKILNKSKKDDDD